MRKFRFFCPLCRQRVRPDNGKFKCKHQGTEHKKGMISDPDVYLLDEVLCEEVGE